MVTVAELLQKQKEPELLDAEKDNDVSTITSVLAGIGSGIFKIPEGLFSLGAALMDLGADTNKVAEVEQFFAKINPFDELAEATAAGRITELITNLAVPGGIAFKAGSGLAKSAILAKKGDKYLDITGQSGKNIAKGIQNTLKAQKKGVKLRGWDRATELGSGALAGGVAEGIFVGDVEEAGTFGDLIGGPTKLERGDDYDPAREIINRVKFGTEGTLFTGALSGIGSVIGKLRDATKAGKVVDGKFNKFIDRWVSQPLRARGPRTKESFQQFRKLEGARAGDLNAAEGIVRELDSSISKLFPFMKRAWGDKTTFNKRRELLKEMNRMLLSSTDNPDKLIPAYQMGKDGLEKISFGSMNQNLVKNFSNKLKKTYKAGNEDIAGILGNLGAMRLGWGQLFTSMGRRLDDDGLKQFKELFGDKVTTWLDSSYDVLKNNTAKVGKAYAPTDEIMKQAKESFKELYKLNTGGGILSDAAAQNEVLKVYKSAGIEKGFKLGSKSDPYLQLPDFFLGKSSLDDALHINTNQRLADLTGVQKDVIENLFGKGNDAFQTILEGTQRLSTVVRRNEYYDNLLNESNKLKELRKVQIDEMIKQGVSRSDAEKRAVTPTFANSETEAAELFGGYKGDDWKTTSGSEKGWAKTQQGFKGVETLGPVDYKQTLRPLAGEKRSTFLKKGAKIGQIPEEIPIHNPLAGKYALNGVVDGLVEPVDNIFASKNFGTQLYANLILYPKATSQMAKTILAPFTHGRNFLSAGAFAMANGIIPFSDMKAVKAAYNALQVAGPGTRKSNEFYQKLLKLGVVNSQVQLGDLMNLLKDVRFGTTFGKLGKARYAEEGLASYGLNRLMKGLSKVKKFSQDAYTAEDDFWKIFTWFGEKGRLDKALRTAGLRKGQEFTDIAGRKVRFTDEWLEETAADLVKNNVPNYAFVSDFIKGLRKWPIGNFVAFPSEIMRTGTNIVDTGLKEIFYKTTINGKIVHPFRSIGLKRLSGMAFTTAAVPYAAVAAGQAIYDVSQDELAAIRRYVADWSKNSTLVPLKDKEGNFKYIDFSHSNAYDTLTRPIQTVINRVQAGETNKDGIMNDFIMGLIESTKEIGSPFITESIWTEALSDLVMRGGETRDGFRVYNKEDNWGNIIQNSVAHLAMAQAPFNWKQMERIGLSMKPVDDLGRFDERGNEYELGNEAAGIVGFRAIKVDPNKSLKYKIADYLKGARDSKSLFTREVLKGGIISPKDIVDAYINANRALYLNQKTMYEDVKAAKTLGMERSDLAQQMSRGVGKKGFGRLDNGIFTPLSISKNIMRGFYENARKLGVSSPVLEALSSIAKIRAQLFRVDLDDVGGFPIIENPLDVSIIPDLVGAVTNTTQLPPLPNPNLATGTQFGGNLNINPASGLTLSEEVLLEGQPLYKAMARQKNQNKMQLQRPKNNITRTT